MYTWITYISIITALLFLSARQDTGNNLGTFKFSLNRTHGVHGLNESAGKFEIYTHRPPVFKFNISTYGTVSLTRPRNYQNNPADSYNCAWMQTKSVPFHDFTLNIYGYVAAKNHLTITLMISYQNLTYNLESKKNYRCISKEGDISEDQ